MARMAVLVDLSFFLARYACLRRVRYGELVAVDTARAVWNTARAHAARNSDEIYRIFVYDCRPLAKMVHNPITKRAIDFSKTDAYRFRTELHNELIGMRKVALRLGELGDRRRWIIKDAPTKQLLHGSLRLYQLVESDVVYDVQQKGVDTKMGVDIASLAYKQLADRVVLVAGDSDFVPAAKLARREGLDVILDPLWAPISPSLKEHIDGLQTTWPRPLVPAASGESTTPPELVGG